MIIASPRAGIVGAGFMGEVHSRAIRAAGGVVTRVVASSPERSAMAADRLGADASSVSIQALVEDPQVDVVHICVPNRLHREAAAMAFAAGKAVVCEKPLATTYEEARLLTDLAQSSGRTATVPFVYRFHPMVREARARVARGDLGSILVIHGSYLQDWLSDSEATDWRVDPNEGGASRAFADIGVHWCDLIEFVSGHRIVAITAKTLAVAGRPRSSSEPTEDVAALVFETDRGALGSLVASQISHGRNNALRFIMDGSRSSCAFDQERPDVLWLGRRSESITLSRGAEDGAEDARRLNLLPPGHPQGYQDAFNLFVRDTYHALAGDAPAGLPTFADGARAARITEAVVLSAREHRSVRIDEVGREFCR